MFVRLIALSLSAVLLWSQTANAQGIVDTIMRGVIQQQQQMQQQQYWEQQRQQQMLQQQENERQRQQQIYQQQLQQQRLEEQRRAQAAAKARADAEAAARQRQLEQEQQRADAEARARAEVEERRRREAANKLRTDPALMAVMGTDRRDITVLVVGRDNGKVIRNLRGDPSFRQSVNGCLPFGGLSPSPNTLEWRFLSASKADIERKGGASLTLTACSPQQISEYDLLIFSSDQISNATIEPLTQVLNALRERQFVRFSIYAVADFEAFERSQQQAAQAELARQQADREATRQAFLVRDPDLVSLIFRDAKAAVVCVLPGADSEGVKYLLTRQDSPFSTLLTPTTKFRTLASADAVFIELKTNGCSVAVGPTDQLRDIFAALVRDNVPVEAHKATIDRAQLADWKKLASEELASAQAEQARRTAEERRRQAELAAEEQQKRTLAEERRRVDDAARREELAKMRKVVESKATADVQMLSNHIRKSIDSIRDDVNEAKQRASSGRVLSSQQEAARKAENTALTMNVAFPDWAYDFTKLAKEGWEFGDFRPAIEDFGRAQWRGRTIEAVAVRVEFPMLNRVVGERRTACYEFVWINDEEFSFMRQPSVIQCGDFDADFPKWAQANAFVSQWKLLQ